MIRIAVFDDEDNIRKYLVSLIKKQGNDFQIDEFSSTQKYLSTGATHDLIFLDIEIDRDGLAPNGMELAKAIRESKGSPQPLIVFVTGHEEYVYDAFDVDAFQYLVKPIDENRFASVFERAIAQITADQQKKEKVLTVQYANTNKTISLSDIYYIESIGHKVILHRKQEAFEYYANISDLELLLKGQFYRIHKGYLINLEYVEGYNKKEVELSSGEKLLISKYRYQEFVKAYLCFMEEVR